MRNPQHKSEQTQASLNHQYAAAGSNDFARAIDGLQLHGFTLQAMRKEDGVFLLRNNDSSWTVEVTQMGLVKTWNESRDWSDFYTWQLHNQSRLLYTEAE
jgi:hypothetical protein